MPALISNRTPLSRSRVLRRGGSCSFEDIQTSVWTGARKANFSNLELSSSPDEVGCTPPITASPINQGSPTFGIGDAQHERTPATETYTRRDHRESQEEDLENIPAPPSPCSLSPPPENKGVWVWPSSEAEMPRSWRNSVGSRDDAERKSKRRDELIVHVAPRPSLLSNGSSSRASFESTCSTAALTERSDSATVDHRREMASTFSTARSTKRSSLNGGALDIPFLHHLCDMSLRFPEPPVGPPPGSRALGIPKRGTRTMGLGLPSTFLPFGCRRGILDSVEHRQQSAAAALHKRSSPSPTVATRNSRRPGDRRFVRKSAARKASASALASEAAAAAVSPPPPPPSVRVTSPSPSKDIGFGIYEGQETVTIKVEQGGTRRKETASPPPLPPPPPPSATVVSSQRSKDFGCSESGRRESLTEKMEQKEAKMEQKEEKMEQKEAKMEQKEAKMEQKDAKMMWLWEPDDSPPEMERILDRRRSGRSRASSCGVHGRRGSELPNTSRGREYASTVIPSE